MAIFSKLAEGGTQPVRNWIKIVHLEQTYSSTNERTNELGGYIWTVMRQGQ